MDNVRFISVAGVDGIEVEHALIDHEDGSYTSMTKAHYEAQKAAQVEHLTSPLTDPTA
jgi:hypothetical protein